MINKQHQYKQQVVNLNEEKYNKKLTQKQPQASVGVLGSACRGYREEGLHLNRSAGEFYCFIEAHAAAGPLTEHSIAVRVVSVS